MKNKNEQGYALLVVVLITVLVMGFFTFFVTASLNNANQEQTVDENHLKVAAAEMGVEYYVAALTNEYNDLLKDIYVNGRTNLNLCNEFKETMLDDEKKYSGEDRYITESYYYTVQENPKFCDDEGDESELEKTKDEEKISVSGVVQGDNTNSDRQEELGFTVTFPVPSFISDNKEEVDNEQEDSGLRLINTPENQCDESHSENDILEGNCYVNRNVKPDRLPSEVESNHYHMHRKKLYLKGNLEMQDGNKGKGNVNIDNSFIYVEGDFIVGNGFAPKNNSRIFIDGDLIVGPGKGNGNPPAPDSNSKICVTGKIKRNTGNQKEIDNKYSLGNGEGLIYTRNKSYIENGAKYVGSNEELKAACGIIDNSIPPDDEDREIWFPPEKTDVEYN